MGKFKLITSSLGQHNSSSLILLEKICSASSLFSPQMLFVQNFIGRVVEGAFGLFDDVVQVLLLLIA